MKENWVPDRLPCLGSSCPTRVTPDWPSRLYSNPFTELFPQPLTCNTRLASCLCSSTFGLIFCPSCCQTQSTQSSSVRIFVCRQRNSPGSESDPEVNHTPLIVTRPQSKQRVHFSADALTTSHRNYCILLSGPWRWVPAKEEI